MSDERFISLRDVEKYAAKSLPPVYKRYTNDGAGDGVTMRDNEAAFQRWRLRPRFMVDVSKRTTKTIVLGSHVDFPVGIAPSAMNRLAHPDGEVAVARAAQDLNTIYIMSQTATSSVEEVSAAAPNGTKWLQIYIPRDRQLTKELITRAKRAGFKALVMTVDAPHVGMLRSTARHPLHIPSHIRLGNYGASSDKMVNAPNNGVPFGAELDDRLTWDDVDWLKAISNLPIIVKGVMTSSDAELAIQHGAAAILVSNHGGRQIDGNLATIDVLPEIVEAVKGKAEVYLDGGIRTGTDVIKALGLGAKAVFLGRPIIWGLSYKGYEGVNRVLSIIKEELDMGLALLGCSSPTHITRSHVIHENSYAKL
ncbi:2-Hydroxyacid oxidase 1-like [Lineus longissimus]|uniref:2-Hydroxyacid oxidase 1-like n=1 Tax=Lineus longissimus TaxID=88925 RepID=UPI002B4E0FFD